MYSFAQDYGAEIAAITTRREFQSADVVIEDDSNYDPDAWDLPTGQYTGPSPEEVYSGQARIIGIRWGTSILGETQENSTTLKSVRVQIPRHGTGRVQKGLTVRFTAAPNNPSLVGRTVRITSDFQGANAASRTFECSNDGDQDG